MSEAELEVYNQMKTAGENLATFAGNSMGLAVKLAAIPASVAVLSIPKKVARVLAGKYNEKTAERMMESKSIVELIDRVLEGDDSPSVEFPKRFLYRVDLSENSKDFNMELLGYLAYYRYCYDKEESGEFVNGESNEAFQEFISFLNKSKERKLGVSKKFKDNKLVNELISEFLEKKDPDYENEYYNGGITRRA